MIRAVLLLLALLTAGCDSSTSLSSLPPPSKAVVYRLGPGDRVRITVYGEERLSGEYTVSGSGLITLPLAGEVKATGRTLSLFAAAVTVKLAAGFVLRPRVVAEMVSYRPVYILGEVARPGQYPYAERMTVYMLVAQAGGFSYRANEKRARIRHDDAADERDYRITSATPVRPGDTVRIVQRYF